MNDLSPYSNTPVNGYYLDVYEDIKIDPDSSDEFIEVTPEYALRPDLLSYELYGTPQLWWVFMRRNMDVITDPIYDFISGIKIYVPSKTRVMSLF